MNTLQQIEQLLLPIWNKLYKKDKENIPKSFIKLMTYIIPKYKDANFDTFIWKLKKRGIITALRTVQIDLIEFGILSINEEESLGVLIDLFNNDSSKNNLYTTGQFIGYGAHSYVFRLREYKNLVIKIPFNEFNFDEENINAKAILEKELEIGNILKKIGISVPRYLGVFQVKFPEYFDKTIEREVKRSKIIPYFLWKPLKKNAGKIRWGLIMEFIEKDLTLVSTKRLEYLYRNELKKVLTMGINNVDAYMDHNVLWSRKNAKIYFIDFESWVIPKKFLQK